MKKSLETVGFIVLALGLSALLNHYWSGWRLFNLVNGLVLPRLPTLQPFELYVDLVLAALGLGIMLAATALSPREA